MRVGFVGTGSMDRPMAKSILKAWHQMTVFDLQPEATAPLEAPGGPRAADLPSPAREVRVTPWARALRDYKAREADLAKLDTWGLLAFAEPKP